MIDYSAEILEKLLNAAHDAYVESIYPFVCGAEFTAEVAARLSKGSARVTDVMVSDESLMCKSVNIVDELVVAIGLTERLSLEQAFQRAMKQCSLELAAEIERLTGDFPVPCADSPWQNEDFWTAASLVAAHLVSGASVRFQFFDAKSLHQFLLAELCDTNCFVRPYLQAMRGCGKRT